MSKIKLKYLFVCPSSRKFSATFITPIGEIETKIELPISLIKEIEDKSGEAFICHLNDKKNEMRSSLS